MRFYLNYRGRLPSNGSPKQKHDLRLRFHPQLVQLWNQTPLSGFVSYVGRKAEKEPAVRHDDFSIIEQVGQNFFAPLVTDKLNLVCELSVTMLRPEQPGGVISGGDIDNRLKTLFDALSMPPNANQIPSDIEANDPANPVYCLLKDDNLISSVSVRCDRLLDATEPSEVLLFIHVTVRATQMTFGNIGISG